MPCLSGTQKAVMRCLALRRQDEHIEELAKRRIMDRDSEPYGDKSQGAQQACADAGSPSVAFYILYSASIIGLVAVCLSAVFR